ncbi:hypothetical protein, partial [Propionispora sp. 2/2-37]|uniref:hypothetical protein n=1 Tax=Propionispora sp. 2/2-37 TaxID=1677858 RepID=UPI0006BB669B
MHPNTLNKSNHLKKYLTMAALIVFSLLPTNLIFAQPDDQLDREELRRRTQQETQERQNRQQQKDTFFQAGQTVAEDTSLPE